MGTHVKDPKKVSPTATVAHAFIECPAGTSIKQTYNPKSGEIEPHLEDGQVKRFTFLPFPANYGFIPNTLVPETKGGDGGALDVLVLCETVPPGSVLDIDVIGLFRITDAVPMNDIVIGLPRDLTLRQMDAEHVKDLPRGVLSILRTWAVDHNLEKKVLLRVQGPKAALRAIKRWSVKG